MTEEQCSENHLAITDLFTNYSQKGYALGRVIGDILPVSGGLMHKMFKVQTDKGTYAVKCLNPEIMKRPGAFDNYGRAEALEAILEDNDIPIVSALSFKGKKMLKADGRYFYIFKWQEGQITDWNNISEEQCYKVGEILGKIHAIDPKNDEESDPELSEIDFRRYLKKAKEKECSIASLLEESIEILETAQDKLNEARKKLPPMQVISDDDMDPKNIMWDKGEPFVIDLECLGYSNPIASCLELSLQWAGAVNQKFSSENLAAFYKGYLNAYDNGFRAYDELCGIAYTWVEWLEYNLRRALAMEGDTDEDIKAGEIEVANTIGRIRYLYSIEKDICAVLGELPAPEKGMV
ncbi:aminoglycoside phosphotransferase family protein [Butyrivibrio sp. INlla16]|uniref:aminoglycoside phosphotransferase family protein n=1 Tax=Butyrivibrio sp. INlla16 TaxID=1520807 RepID=UPI00088099F0|nr:aminoglycoside phosphotransferase family protein [Butyrivibrio sp. INlla16]SDB59252.1 Phosphotransferase enzyme family protein [Butyrivibrio sp. INlla16]